MIAAATPGPVDMQMAESPRSQSPRPEGRCSSGMQYKLVQRTLTVCLIAMAGVGLWAYRMRVRPLACRRAHVYLRVPASAAAFASSRGSRATQTAVALHRRPPSHPPTRGHRRRFGSWPSRPTRTQRRAGASRTAPGPCSGRSTCTRNTQPTVLPGSCHSLCSLSCPQQRRAAQQQRAERQPNAACRSAATAWLLRLQARRRTGAFPVR